MNEISSFFCEELNTIADDINTLNEENHSIKLDIEFIDKAILKINENNDEAENTFLSSGNSDSFSNIESEKLNADRAKLLKRMEEIEQLIVNKTDRYNKLKELKGISDDIEIKKSGGINSMSIYEADRRRIAMEIHDTVVQTLTSIIMKNNFILKIMENDPLRAKLQLKNNNDVLKTSIQELRDIIFDLRPMGFDDLNFKEGFSNLCDKLSSNTNMTINYYSDIESEVEDKILMINVLRIVQELVNNSIKHSDGNNIEVELIVKNDLIKLKVQDDGIGFDTDNKENSGFGLSIIRERVNLFNGDINIDSNLEIGTKIIITIPYNISI